MGFGVEDGFDRDLPGRTAPVADLPGGDQLVAPFDPRGAGLSGQGGVGEVDVEHQVPSGVALGVGAGSRQARPAGGPGPGSAAVGRAHRPRPHGAHPGCPASRGPSTAAATAATACSRSWASARSSSPCTSKVPSTESWRCSMVKCRPSARARRRCFGQVGHVVRDRLLHQPLQLDRSDLVREPRHLPIHKPRRLRGEEEGVVGDPPRLPRHQVTLGHALATRVGAGGAVRGRGRRTASPPPWTARSRRRTR